MGHRPLFFYQLGGQETLHQFFQQFRVNGLQQVLGKALLQIHIPGADDVVGSHGNHRHLRAASARLTAQRCQGFLSVHIRHAVVQEDNIIGIFLDLLQALPAAPGCVYGYFGGFQQPLHHREIHGGVIHHQQPGSRCGEAGLVGLPFLQPGSLRRLTEIPGRCPTDDILQQAEGKGRAFPIDASHLQPASHQGQQLAGDVHAQSRALHMAVALFLDALKRRKELLQILGLDADARILHSHFQGNLPLLHLPEACPQGHGACFRIFHPIGQEVGDDLLQAHLIPVEDFGHGLVHFHLQAEALVLCPLLDQVHQVTHDVCRGIFHGNDGELARLYLGKVQDVVHQSQQTASRGLDIPGIAVGVILPGAAQDHLIHAQHRIDGGAYLMGHAGQES